MKYGSFTGRGAPLVVVLADTLPTALLVVVCLAVVLTDARPVAFFVSPKERLAYQVLKLRVCD